MNRLWVRVLILAALGALIFVVTLGDDSNRNGIQNSSITSAPVVKNSEIAHDTNPSKISLETAGFAGPPSVLEIVFAERLDPGDAMIRVFPNELLPEAQGIPQNGVIPLASHPNEELSVLIRLSDDDQREYRLAAKEPGSTYRISVERWPRIIATAEGAEGAVIWISATSPIEDEAVISAASARSMTVGNDGRAVFDGVKPGTYKIWLNGLGWHAENARQQVVVESGKDAQVSFEPKRIFVLWPKFYAKGIEVTLPRQLRVEAEVPSELKEQVRWMGPVYPPELLSPMNPDLRGQLNIAHALTLLAAPQSEFSEIRCGLTVTINGSRMMQFPNGIFRPYGTLPEESYSQVIDIGKSAGADFDPLRIEFVDKHGREPPNFGGFGALGSISNWWFFVGPEKCAVFLPHDTYRFSVSHGFVGEAPPYRHTAPDQVVLLVQESTGTLCVEVSGRFGQRHPAFSMAARRPGAIRPNDLPRHWVITRDGTESYPLDPGEYEVEVWDTRTGKSVVQKATITTGKETRLAFRL